jgi:hypothetical protein
VTISYGEASIRTKLHYICQDLAAAGDAWSQGHPDCAAQSILQQVLRLKEIVTTLISDEAVVEKERASHPELMEMFRRLLDYRNATTGRLNQLWSELNTHAYVKIPGMAKNYQERVEAVKNDPLCRAKFEIAEMVRMASIDIQAAERSFWFGGGA